MIKLIVDTKNSPETWEEFKNNKPGYSIALDGYINAITDFDPKGPYANFDHHYGVNRLSTRSTCDQILLSIRQEFFFSF